MFIVSLDIAIKNHLEFPLINLYFDSITLDFNYVYNPNCARSSFYNCPYAEFDIPVAIRAGEMIPTGH